MKAYIVFGTTGEYSDRSEWPVKGFLDKQKAETFEFEATKWAHAWDKNKPSRYHHPDKSNPDDISPFDPDFSCDYTGTDYYTVEVEIDP